MDARKTLVIIAGIAIVLAVGLVYFFRNEFYVATRTITSRDDGYESYGRPCSTDSDCTCSSVVPDACGKPGQYPGCVEGRCGFKTDSFYLRTDRAITALGERFCGKSYGPNEHMTVPIESVYLCNNTIRLVRGCCDLPSAILDANGNFLAECSGKTSYSAECQKLVDLRTCSPLDLCQIKDWQLYRNEQYGFEVQYPPSLMPRGWPGQTFLVKKEASDAERLDYSDHLVEIRVDTASYRFEKYSNTADGSIVEGYGDLKIRSYMIDGYKAVEYGYDETLKEKEIDEQRMDLESGASVAYVHFPKGLIINKNGTIIEISTRSYFGDFSNIFEQILSTFTFITDLETPLMRIVWSGGLCPSDDGGGQMCTSEFLLKNDGSYISGQNKGTVSNVEADRLRLLMNSADFASIKSKKLIGTCGRSYDESSPTYTFYLEGREEVIDSCDVEIDSSSPLFSEISNITGSIFNRL